MELRFRWFKKTQVSQNWSEVGPEFDSYKHVAEQLSVLNGLLLSQDRIVIPTTVRHNDRTRGHQGIVKTKQMLRQAASFPPMNSMVADVMLYLVSSCYAWNQESGTPTHVSYVQRHADGSIGQFPSRDQLLFVYDDFNQSSEVEIISALLQPCNSALGCALRQASNS